MSEKVKPQEVFANKIANKLFELMSDFDEFDLIIHMIEAQLELISHNDVDYVMKYYDLVELHKRVKHYIDVLTWIDRRLTWLLNKRVKKREELK